MIYQIENNWMIIIIMLFKTVLTNTFLYAIENDL